MSPGGGQWGVLPATLLLATISVAGCGGTPESGSDRRVATSGLGDSGDTTAAPREATLRRDSLALTAPGGVQVWYTMARDVVMADGRRCEHRALEIRHGSTRVPVPLLYTASPPELADDSTLRARLWTECDPGDLYLVDLTTGQPIREAVVEARRKRRGANGSAGTNQRR
ncbi:MAG: hypothetical protein H0W67_00455 [Gemmatimonadales bacterium]|nr:hypothetical protein [Gemmatimonadales bacterium]